MITCMLIATKLLFFLLKVLCVVSRIASAESVLANET